MIKKFLILSLFFMPLTAFAFETGLPPLQESPAYKQFALKPKSELSKLIFLLSRFKEAKVKIIYGGYQYDAPEAAKLARDYLLRNYHKESADYWIRNYCSKSKDGKVILAQSANNETQPAVDIALKELSNLEAAGKL